MNSNLITIALFLIFPLFFINSFASANDFTTDKISYNTNDSIIISGSINYDPESIIIQIITPSGSGLAHVDSVIPKSDGTFTKIINAGGPTWSENGEYKIKIFLLDEILEKFIEYQKSSEYVPPTTTQNTTKQNTATPNISVDNSFIENPKMIILGFPSFDKSPQYYIDRYNSESAYRNWFDSQFLDYTLDEVVGYKSTHVENFPSVDNSPQYYIDRYSNEPGYRSWFDFQFPGQTIYDILGFSTYVPDWIKTYAENWAAGDISDHEFTNGLDFMLKNKIMVIPNLNSASSIDEIPHWFRNTAHWWSVDLISQQEFINSIKYLIQEDIILVE